MGLDPLSPSTCVHLSLTPLPPLCGRHKWIAPCPHPAGGEAQAYGDGCKKNPLQSKDILEVTSFHYQDFMSNVSTKLIQTVVRTGISM